LAKGLLDEMGFGKHRYDLVIDVIKNDTTYMTWLIEEKIVELDNQAFEEYQKEVERS
jgi:hypothetical protein